MAHKQVLFRSAAREKILRGATQLADAVRVTLGPEIEVGPDPEEMGRADRLQRRRDDRQGVRAQGSRGEPRRADAAAGGREDRAMWSATARAPSTILAHADLRRRRAQRRRRRQRHRPQARPRPRRQGRDRGAARDVASRSARARRRRRSATISAHNDPAIGELVADAMEKVGGEGVITVEESKTTETMLEVVEGMQFDRGYLSPYFVTDPEKMEAVLEDPLCPDLREEDRPACRPMLPLLEAVVQSGRPLLIVAEDVEGEALATLVVNQFRGALKICGGQGAGLRRPPQGDAPGHRRADRRPGDLRGARPQARERDARACSARPSASSSTRTTRPSSAAPASKRTSTAGSSRSASEIEETTTDYDREKLQERLAKLAGGVAVIRVGAPSEAEMKAKKEALDDAISATKAAVAEGIVPGGGLALLRCIDAVAQEEAQVRGRRADRRADPEAGARGAGAADRRELGRRRRRGGRAHAGRQGHIRVSTPPARNTSTCRGRHHRSDQGRARRAGERRVGRERAAADRGDDDRDPGSEKRAIP